MVALMAMPILTRLYSPADFAILAAYVAIISTISVVACLRFDVALPLAETETDSKYLLFLACSSLVLMVTLSSLIVAIFPSELSAVIKQPGEIKILWLIPIGVAAMGFYSIMQFWATRSRRFTQLAKIRINQAIIGSITSLSLGYLGLGSLGLVIGNLINTSAGSLTLAFWSWRNERKCVKLIYFREVLEVFAKYKYYPIYSVPESLFNVAGNQIPIIFIAALGGADAGFLMLATQIMTVPVSLLGGSISQVYSSRALEKSANGELATFTKNIMLQLFKVGLIPFMLIAILAQHIIPYAFGERWERTGLIILWLAPGLFLQYIVSPVSMAIYVAGKQSYALYLQIFGFLTHGVMIFTGYNYFSEYLAEFYAIAIFIFYTMYFVVVSFIIRKE